jgi:hypothetical protein
MVPGLLSALVRARSICLQQSIAMELARCWWASIWRGSSLVECMFTEVGLPCMMWALGAGWVSGGWKYQ